MADQYLHRLVELIERAGSTNDAALDEVAERFATTLAAGGLVHLYGSGHSVLPCQEAFPRYGSYVGFNPLTAVGPGDVDGRRGTLRVAHEPHQPLDALRGRRRDATGVVVVAVIGPGRQRGDEVHQPEDGDRAGRRFRTRPASAG